MHDNDKTSCHSDRRGQQLPQPAGPQDRHGRIAPLGGEPLEGSGFEVEIPEPDPEWRDPR